MTQDDRMETITAETDNPTVCITHGRFIPCRNEDWHHFTDNPYWVKSVRDFQGSDDPNLTWEPATLTITDPALIRASDEPDERTTPAPVGAAVALDLDAARAMLNAANTIKATGGAVEIGGVRIEPCDEYGSTVTTARAESAEAEVVTLRARLAAVEAAAHDWPCSDDTCDGDCTGCSYASDLRAALAVTTGEGE